MPTHRHVTSQQQQPPQRGPMQFRSPSPTTVNQNQQQKSFYATPGRPDFRSPPPTPMQSFYDPNNAAQFVPEPVAFLAKTYGGQIAEQGKQQVGIVTYFLLRIYFAVIEKCRKFNFIM